MEAQAVTKYVRMAPAKAHDIVRLIRGRPATEALADVELIPRKAARMVAQTLRSAIANAENADEPAVPARLTVREAVVGRGPTMRRFRTKARGMAGRVRKRTSHIRIVVTDES
jgi:large subunit ribosomal protein L22